MDENRAQGKAPRIAQQFIQSAGFQLFVMVVILANGVVAANLHFKHDGRPRHEFYHYFFYAEVRFLVNFFFVMIYRMAASTF